MEIKVGYKQRILEVEANFRESMEREQEAMEAMESKYEKTRDQLREAEKKSKSLEKTVCMHGTFLVWVSPTIVQVGCCWTIFLRIKGSIKGFATGRF